MNSWAGVHRDANKRPMRRNTGGAVRPKTWTGLCRNTETLSVFERSTSFRSIHVEVNPHFLTALDRMPGLCRREEAPSMQCRDEYLIEAGIRCRLD